MSASRISATALLLMASIVVTAVGLEVGLRLLAPRSDFAVTVNTWDRDLGTRQVPGARGFVVCRDYDIDLVVNSKGLRDREYPHAKPHGTRRILCLGDSYACGYGVEAEDTFPKVLERVLAASRGQDSRWEVINAGVGSTGTAHHLAYFAKEGYKYEPDFVVLCFCEANDFWDNAICGLYSLDAGELTKHDAPLTGARRIQRVTRWIPAYNTLFARSHLLNLVKYRVARFHYRHLAEKAQRMPDEPAGNSADDGQDLELTEALVLALRDTCEACGSRLIMMVVPSPSCEDQLPETDALVVFIESESICHVDLLPRFRERIASGTPCYHVHDRHWNANGHWLAAEVLLDYLQRECRLGQGRMGSSSAGDTPVVASEASPKSSENPLLPPFQK